jgi:hypothetical protein
VTALCVGAQLRLLTPAERQPGPDLVIVIAGYSQGGHAAMATHRAMERDNEGEFNIVAVADMAGPYHLSAALVGGIANAMLGVQVFLPFEITAWQKVYGNVYAHASDVFKSPYDSYVESLFPAADETSLTTELSGGTPQKARDAMYQASFLSDLASNPNNGSFVAAKKQDLLGWAPKAPVLLCGSTGDPVVDFIINAQAAYDDFKSRGATVTLLDVDPQVQRKYGSVLASDPATYTANYHGTFESTLCCQAAKTFFDQHR